ncbi:MAG: hypothetical protein VX798_15645 [Bacteroidota bacterium]|nr:hypothetical protein [Bacteroidota bacterium]
MPNQSKAQNDGAAIAAGVGALALIGAGVAAVEQMKERAELTATQWVLSNHPEMTSFSLKTIDFDGKKVKDMSSATLISFKIQEFEPKEDSVLDGQKFVLLGFTSHGWINEYGIDFSKVKWFMLDKTEWTKMMTAYVEVASGSDSVSEETIVEGKIVNRGVRVKGKNVLPFYKMSGDMYVVTDYSNEMKFVYNERSLGIFLKDTRDLVQIKRGSLIELHEFFFEEN